MTRSPIELFWTATKYLKSGQPKEKEDDLNPADDRESREKSHGSTNQAQLGLGLDLLVSLDVVEGGGLKEDLHQVKLGIL